MTGTPATNKTELEVLKYLDDKAKDTEMLHKYPFVKKVFICFNGILPSSAPVERLFSSAGMISTPKRRQLSDHLFEMLLLLKGN